MNSIWIRFSGSIEGLRAVGVSADDRTVASAAEWLLRHQQSCGGWGESADSYADPSVAGRGETTPSQTAWALAGLLAAGHAGSQQARRGVAWLVDRQTPDGDWAEENFTGTGFPKVFYLRYHWYRIYFPLMALGRWSMARAAADTDVGPFSEGIHSARRAGQVREKVA